MQYTDPPSAAHEAPPSGLKDLFKEIKKLKTSEVDQDPRILDFSKADTLKNIERVKLLDSSCLEAIFRKFLQNEGDIDVPLEDRSVYCYRELPGLLIIPSLLPCRVQMALLGRLLHRDLSNSSHMTNLHKHYHPPYPRLPIEVDGSLNLTNSASHIQRSFFSYPITSETKFHPKDPESNQPLSIAKVMQKSLRWITLGGQYDWTKKLYPDEDPPPFPSDVAGLLEGLFPEMKAQAAIVNLYSPGDTLSLHRDVSENSDKGLVSISLGCECLFVIGHEDPSHSVVVRLRSGDGVFMGGDARYAWHGVPKVMPGTCPAYLKTWPAVGGQFEEWCGWMDGKRINLNVRQMYD